MDVLADGERTTLDVFRFELTHVLGEEGVRELERVEIERERPDA